MLKIYYANIKNLTQPWEQYPVSESRLEKTARYAHVSDQARSIGAELLLNSVLKKLFPGFNPPAEFETGEHGKPFLKPGQKELALWDGRLVQYNLSHSGDFAACAVSSCPVGVDIEKEQDSIRPGIIRFFSEKEQKALGESKDLASSFFDYWVLKESYMKALGTGFVKPPRSFSIYMENGTYRVWDQEQLKDYDFYLYSIPKGYRLAVCTARFEGWETSASLGSSGPAYQLERPETDSEREALNPQEIILPEQFSKHRRTKIGNQAL